MDTKPFATEYHGAKCPACGHMGVRERFVIENFEFSKGASSTTLTAQVPVCTCENCGFEFTDSRAEEIRHAAVCRHLGILSPAEIQAIRERYAMTQQAFAELTGVGRASLTRWETGSLLQTASSDNLLFLLGYTENKDRLEARRRGTPLASAIQTGARRFRAIRSEEMVQLAREATSFNLYPCH